MNYSCVISKHMNNTIASVDDLFESCGWNIIKNDYNRSYFRSHFELDEFKIEYINYDVYKIVVPLELSSFWAYIPTSDVYTYLYDHLKRLAI